MAIFYPVESAGVRDGSVPISRGDGRVVDAKLKRLRATITQANQVAGTDQVEIGVLPAGASFHECHVNGAVVSATAALAVGTSPVHGSNGQFRPAAVVAAANVKERTSPIAAVTAAPFTVQTPVWLTWALANLSASGQLVVEIFYSTQQ